MKYQTVPATQEASEIRMRHQANRLAWNQAAVSYAEEVSQTIAFLKAGRSNLHPVERAMLGDLRSWCRNAIHLQCASGQDTLSLINEGVEEVVGIDISDAMIENARRTSAALGMSAAWFCCDVLETPHELDGRFDLVYTGRGAICWIHQLEAWAAVVCRLLKPGGALSLFDDHPVINLFDHDAEKLSPSGIDYFTYAESSQGWPSSYLGDLSISLTEHATKFERLWTLGAIVSAVRQAGLTIEHLSEHAERYWESFPNLNPELRRRIPLTFSLLARKSA